MQLSYVAFAMPRLTMLRAACDRQKDSCRRSDRTEPAALFTSTILTSYFALYSPVAPPATGSASDREIAGSGESAACVSPQTSGDETFSCLHNIRFDKIGCSPR